MTEQLKASLSSEGMRRIYDFWESRHRDGRLPRREDIDPGDVADLLPSIFLVDVEENPRRYRVRLAGTKVVEFFGVDVTGETMDSLDFGDRAAPILKQYDQAVENREPIYDRHRYWTEAYEQHLNYERLLLPLSSDGEHVDKLIGYISDLPLETDTSAPE